MTFLKNESVPYETECVRIYRFAFSYGEGPMNDSLLTRIAWRWPSVPWTRRRMTIATKKRILMTRMSMQRSYHDENFTVTGMLDDVVLVMSCADVEIALKYLTTFVVTSVCQLLRRTLYPGVFVIDDIGVSSDAFPFDGWHLLYCIAYEKGILSPVRQIERMSAFSSTLRSLSYFFEFARKETRLDDASGRGHFVL